MSFYSRLSKFKLNMRVSMIVIVAELILIGGIYAATTYQQPLAHAFTLATTHQPERYSELYFDNSTRLPLSMTAGTGQFVTFHITNHEAAETTYRYVVTQQTGKTITDIKSGSISLADEQGTDIRFGFTIPTPQTTAQITIHLVDQNQSITFRSKS